MWHVSGQVIYATILLSYYLTTAIYRRSCSYYVSVNDVGGVPVYANSSNNKNAIAQHELLRIISVLNNGKSGISTE